MLTSRNKSQLVVALALLFVGLGSVGGCVDKLDRSNGTCEPIDAGALSVPCDVDGLGNTIAVRDGVAPLGAYACTGAARPDDSPTIAEGVPKGRICTGRKLADESDPRVGYCCTEFDTDCAYNPVADCPAATETAPAKYGFQCRGSQRPEVYNPTIYCDQAIRDGDLLDYCCSDYPKMSGSCVATAGCPSYLTAWTCRDPNDTPRSQELLASKSRADTFYMTCTIPVINPNGTQFYCCFTPGVIADGGTCSQHTSVPGCAPGRFGYACLGPDTPGEDFPVMNCPDPGVSGTSMEGYPATLYCCDYVAKN
jgi:hypothetical protein